MGDLDWDKLIAAYRRHHDERRRRQVAGCVVIIALLVFLLSMLIAERLAADTPERVTIGWTQPAEVYRTKIDSFLAVYFARTNGRGLRRAREVLPVLLDVCEDRNINPALVASIITHESTWDPEARGSLGEIGLMQINRRDVPADARGQIEAGVSLLLDCYSRCGTVLGAVSLYATGRSCESYRGAERRIAMAVQIEGR